MTIMKKKHIFIGAGIAAGIFLIILGVGVTDRMSLNENPCAYLQEKLDSGGLDLTTKEKSQIKFALNQCYLNNLDK